jgi:predicted DNA-binding transcriptional regulator AlpA
MYRTFDEINDATGFANGDMFESAEEVRAYFTRENMRDMSDAEWTLAFDPEFDCYQGMTEDQILQSMLDDMAEMVITSGWHIKPVLLGISEIAEEVNARRQTVAQWYNRNKLPEPTQVLAAGPVWTREAIQDWITAKSLLSAHGMDTLANYMDNDLREQAHRELAPCAEERYLARYLTLHREQFGEEFTIN